MLAEKGSCSVGKVNGEERNERKAVSPAGREALPAEGVERVGAYRRPGKAHEHGLVILAMGLPYWLIPEEDGYGLYVKTEYMDAVLDQIERYERDNRMWPPREEVLPKGEGSAASLVLFVVALWAFFVGAGEEVIEAGLLSADFFEGEWWRPVTALTLHGDWGHLMGNTVGGIFFMLLVFRFAGYGLGWLAVILGGVAGNIINIVIMADAGHRSIGASTSVFAALGLVVGFRVLQTHRAGGWRFPKQLWIPVMGGFILLGMLGAGGERTDVMAHVWGFAAGALFGAILGHFRVDLRTEILPQRLLAVLALAVVGAAWAAGAFRYL